VGEVDAAALIWGFVSGALLGFSFVPLLAMLAYIFLSDLF